MGRLTPSYDNKIAQKYSAKTLDQKVQNKLALQEELGWVAEPKRAILCFPDTMTDESGGTLLESILEGIEELDVEILVRGKGSEKFGKMFTELAKDKKHRIHIMQDNEEEMRKMFAASDIALFLSPSKDKELVENILRYGVVPISPPSDKLENYNPVQETGNAFIYENAKPWQCFAALVRALETFRFPFDWRTIQRHAMETVPHK